MVHERGVTLLDTVVGISLMLVIFLGIAAAFQLSLDVVQNNKARGGAVALLNERMEYIRSLPYTSIGTVGGVPSGSLAQSESVTYNGIPYTRRTLVEYADDPKDGTSPADTNPADYKAVKVDVSWVSRTGTRDDYLVSRFEPATGLESAVSGGTLTVNVNDSSAQPLSNAQVHITNTGSSPTVDVTTYTNSSGAVSLIGAPAASGYAVVVSKTGYSSAQTYASSGSNPNPSPGPLTVSNGLTTSSTFAIDTLSTLTIVEDNWSDGSPLPNIPMLMQGAKTIGTNPTVYKYNSAIGGSGATTTVPDLEWDTYTLSVNPSTGYDLAASCSPQPLSISAGTTPSVTIYLAPHTVSSLPVAVYSNSTGALIPGASVRLYATGYDTTQTTNACGQTFFSGLSSGTYSMSVSAGGYTTFNSSSVAVGTTTPQYSVHL